MKVEKLLEVESKKHAIIYASEKFGHNIYDLLPNVMENSYTSLI